MMFFSFLQTVNIKDIKTTARFLKGNMMLFLYDIKMLQNFERGS